MKRPARIAVGCASVLLLTAAALTSWGEFRSSPTSATGGFTTAQGFDVAWLVCYGAPPAPGATTCPASSPLTAGADLISYETTSFPAGSRLTSSITTYTPSVWGTSTAPGDDTILMRTDLYCDGSSDVVAGGPNTGSGDIGTTGNEGPGAAWNDLSLWNPYPLIVQGSVPGHLSGLKPTPPSFTAISDQHADVRTFWLGGSAPLFWPAMQGYATNRALPVDVLAETAPPFQASATVSSLMINSDPGPPSNAFACADSPEDVMISNSRFKAPASAGRYPRWTLLTSAPDAHGPIPITSSSAPGQTAPDTSVTRVLLLSCAVVGTPSGTDNDGDCLSTPADTADSTADQDADGLPDGVEAAAGSPVTSADVDADGATDYEELFQFTNPAAADTDGDGSLDRQDTREDETPSGILVDDTIADDNCPAVANSDQLNTDSAPSYHGGRAAWDNINFGTTGVGTPPGTAQTNFGGVASIVVAGTTATVTTNSAHNFIINQLVEVLGVTGMGGTAAQNNSFRRGINGVLSVETSVNNTFTFTVPALSPPVPAGTATGTIVIRPASGDATNPGQDIWGDACDTDDDNDALPDVAEQRLTIVSWTGPGSTVCGDIGEGATPAITLSALSGDSDGDMVLDGIECAFGSRPDIASAAVASCSTAPVDPAGCSKPKAAASGEDPDGDRLYVTGIPAAHSAIESFYRTGSVSRTGGGQSVDLDADGSMGLADSDSDADWNLSPTPSALVALQDGVEVRFYRTSPASADSDLDGCDDGREVADVNGDRTVSPGDQAFISNRVTFIASLDNGKAGDATASDGYMNPYGINFDLNKDGVLNPGDTALAGFFVGHGGACRSTRQLGIVVTNLWH